MRVKEKPVLPKSKGVLLIFAGIALALVTMYGGNILGLNVTHTMGNILTLLSNIGVSIVVYAVGRMVSSKKPRSLQLPDPNLSKHYAKGLFVGTVMIVVYVGIATLLGGIKYQGAGGITTTHFLLYILAFAIQGFSEELLVRGLIQEVLARRNRMLSIVAPSILFSLMHLGNDNFSFFALINTALIGLLFALMTDMTGSLWMASAAHSIWNFLLGPFFGLYVSGIPMDESLLAFPPVAGKEAFSGGLYGPEAAPLLAIIIIIFIIPFFLAYKKKDQVQIG